MELVGEVCRRAEPLAAELELTLRFVCGMERHVCAAAPRELERLLYHLLSNAFKFTPAGGTVTVELKTAGKQVLLSVEDTGRGIEPERLETLFDRCLHESLMDPRPHGLGLGLALCRAIAQGHGGSIMAQSHEGRGSRFTVSLPDRRAENGTVSDVPLDYSGGFNRTPVSYTHLDVYKRQTVEGPARKANAARNRFPYGRPQAFQRAAPS